MWVLIIICPHWCPWADTFLMRRCTLTSAPLASAMMSLSVHGLQSCSDLLPRVPCLGQRSLPPVPPVTSFKAFSEGIEIYGYTDHTGFHCCPTQNPFPGAHLPQQLEHCQLRAHSCLPQELPLARGRHFTWVSSSSPGQRTARTD